MLASMTENRQGICPMTEFSTQTCRLIVLCLSHYICGYNLLLKYLTAELCIAFIFLILIIRIACITRQEFAQGFFTAVNSETERDNAG